MIEGIIFLISENGMSRIQYVVLNIMGSDEILTSSQSLYSWLLNRLYLYEYLYDPLWLFKRLNYFLINTTSLQKNMMSVKRLLLVATEK